MASLPSYACPSNWGFPGRPRRWSFSPAATGDSAAAQASLAAHQRTCILWGVLLLGVALLGGMAWKLIRQMKAGSDKAT